MPPSHHKRLVLLLLLALLVPCGVLVFLSVRMIRQERELAEKRETEEQQKLTSQIRQDLLHRLERIKLQELSAFAGPRGRGYSNPATALLAPISEDSLILPWEENPAGRQFLRAIREPEFALRIRQGERQELVERKPTDASRRYRDALQAATHPAQKAYARLLLARALTKSGEHTQACVDYREILSLPANLVDDHGVPFKLYAAGRLKAEECDHGAVLSELQGLIETPGLLTPAAWYMIRDLAGGATDLRPAVEERIREVEQILTLRSSLRKLVAALEAASQRLQDGEPVWIPFGEPAWLVSTARVRDDRPVLLAVRAGQVFQTLPATGFRFLASGSSEGRPLGDNFLGLRIAFAGAADTSPGEWNPAQYFYLVTLLLALTITLVGALLLWRDVRRELHIAEMRAQFVSSVSHELKTPLTAIRMFAETLRMGRWKDKETQEEYLDTIVNESERLTRLVDNVLDFSRIERGKKIYQLKQTALATVVETAARAVQYPLSRQGFRLKTQVEDSLPPVKADADALEQAVLNLLINAMKYSGEAREIELRLRRTNGRASIEVTDHGVGIPAEEQKHIFEKFYRVPTRENQLIPGAGLGLTLVEHVAKAHGGEVTVESEPGKGSTFSIRFPLEGGR